MVDIFAETFEEIIAWGESCSCRWKDRPFTGVGRHHRGHCAGRRQRRAEKDLCPLSTMRAPELSRGALMRLVQRLLNVAQSRLFLNEEVVKLHDDERKPFLEEFSRARRQILFHLQFKGAFWRSLTALDVVRASTFR